ncbi:MAG: winged helix-turn-helix transcriptional regulator [Candidatus Yanofskybacteria bacterium]|nr:winged helix-turn-helix transcriptional regulator [Candidatus Yanofskybacteria bacterium]
MDIKTRNRIKKELSNKKALVKCACDFNVLGDLTRMKICYLLCKHKELSVSEIAGLVGVSVSAVSHSLKALRKCCLVKSRRDIKSVYYRIDKESPLFGTVKRQITQSR